MTPLDVLTRAKGCDMHIVRAVLSMKRVPVPLEVVSLIVDHCAEYRYDRVLADFLGHDQDIEDVTDTLADVCGWTEKSRVLRDWGDWNSFCGVEWTDNW